MTFAAMFLLGSIFEVRIRSRCRLCSYYCRSMWWRKHANTRMPQLRPLAVSISSLGHSTMVQFYWMHLIKTSWHSSCNDMNQMSICFNHLGAYDAHYRIQQCAV